MKQLIFILALSIAFASCQKQNNAPSNANAHTTPPSTTSTLTITVNSATITAGQSITLTANGASSYTWSTGATTNSITVLPTSTTSYTVTGTQGNNTGTAISVITVTTGTTMAADSIWFRMLIDIPTTTAFTYKYDTTNVRVLVNSKKVNGNQLNLVLDNVSNGIGALSNYTPNLYLVKMNQHDTLTVEIDSLYYFINSGTPSMGDIYLDINKKPYNPLTCLVDAKIICSTVTSGHIVGLAPISAQTYNQTWYLGGKFTYKWIKP